LNPNWLILGTTLGRPGVDGVGGVSKLCQEVGVSVLQSKLLR
jgi:SpoU rRNA methylase family enzyme